MSETSPTLGLYFDFRNPEPWHRDPAAYYGWHLDLMEEADRRGVGSLWVTEHHFVEDGYLPQPLTALAAIAARTKQCRLGTGVVVAPLMHPMAIAEQAALVDIMSNGRLELGLGAGYVAPEFEAFGVELADRYHATDHALAEVGRIWAERECTPGPVQDPPPIWAGYLGPVGARRAGRLGVGLMTWNADSWPVYRDALAEFGHDPAIARMGGVVDFILADDPERMFEEILPHRTHQLNSYRQNAARGSGRTPRVLTVDEVREGRGSGVIAPLQILTVADAAERVRSICADAPIEQLYLWASIGGMPEHLVERQMELLVDELQPAIAD
ncbi:MAG: alkanesulfonate monooxygenase SsuD [Candidatus Aldehydirespiratoraceae bacterium]|jgi:alkanesulfonate monooxygenase SsuD/methylene tetrahydromethanopterin reductase-like flavin-dependent oxidoreductase (luciferase family)